MGPTLGFVAGGCVPTAVMGTRGSKLFEGIGGVGLLFEGVRGSGRLLGRGSGTMDGKLSAFLEFVALLSTLLMEVLGGVLAEAFGKVEGES